MERFRAPFGEVELTDEREQHIIQFHPEIKAYIIFFQDTIAEPEHIGHSVFDPNVIICYRFVHSVAKHLAVVIKTNRRNFILTAYFTHKIKHT